MFLESSIRSLRTISFRSPTRSSSFLISVSTSGARARSPARPDRGRTTRRRCDRSRVRAEHLERRGAEGARPALGVEPGGARAMEAHSACATYSGSTRTELGPQNGVWVKCTMCRSGRPREHLRDERELVVLDQHVLAVGGHVDDRLGEGPVHLDVALPRLAEAPVEAGPAGQIEQPVVQEPDHAVRDDVVVQPRVCGSSASSRACTPPGRRRAGGDRGAVVLADRRGDPGRVFAVREQRHQRGDHSTRAAVRGEGAVRVGDEAKRPAVRDDDHAVRLTASVPKRVSQSSSSRVDRKFWRTCSLPRDAHLVGRRRVGEQLDASGRRTPRPSRRGSRPGRRGSAARCRRRGRR